MTTTQKYKYISAVKCLQRLPATSSFAGVKTRFDDFQALHISLSRKVHLVVGPLILPSFLLITCNAIFFLLGPFFGLASTVCPLV